MQVGQLSLFGETLAKWTDSTMKKAASEFEIPGDTRILIVFPDLFDRDELIKHPAFKFEFTDDKGSRRVTVKTPCPWCQTNKFVTFPSKVGYKEGTSRSIADFRTCIPIVTPIGSCSNPACQGNPNRAKKKGSDTTFHLYEACVWSKYPLEVREQYTSTLYTEVADGQNGEIFVSEDLCKEILKDDAIIAASARHMKESFERHRTRAIEAYSRFIQSQLNDTTKKDNLTEQSWPRLNLENYDKVFRPPSKDKLGKIFDRCFDLVYPFLQRDLYSRTPGVCVKWDGTFDFAKKTMNDPHAQEEINVLCIICGQYGHVMSFAFSKSECSQVYQRMNYFLRKRCDRLGKSHEVQFAVSDVCCEGLDDPSKHWVASVWPNVQRAPYKDLMHGQKKVFDGTRGASHELHRTFTSEMKDKCMLWDVRSQQHVFKLYKKEEQQPSLTHEIGIQLMMQSDKYRNKILNYIPNPQSLAASVEEAYANLVADDDALNVDAQLQGKGYLSYILKPIRGVCRGTKAEIDNMCCHIRKGCYTYPLPPEMMAHKINPEDEYSDLVRFASTSQGEATNKQINRLTKDIGQQGAERGNKRLWLRVTRYNLDKDARLAKLLGLQKPRSLEWYLHEALLQKHPCTFGDLFGGMLFPPQLPEGYFEPMGIDYGRYKEWDNIQMKIYEMEMGMHDEAMLPIMDIEEATPPSTEEATINIPVQQNLSQNPASPPQGLQSNINSPRTPLPPTPQQQTDASQQSEVAAVALQPSSGLSASPPNGDFYSPQANWRRDLGVKTRVSALNTYVSQSKPLSNVQRQYFWDIVSRVHELLRGSTYSDKEIAQEVARIWDRAHLSKQASDVIGVGLGGLLRPGHAEVLLKEKGHDIRKRPAQPPMLDPPAHQFKSLTREGIESLSTRAAIPWLKKIRQPLTTKTTEGRRQILRKYFEDNPDVREIVIND
jgi:hypothetical protein